MLLFCLLDDRGCPDMINKPKRRILSPLDRRGDAGGWGPSRPAPACPHTHSAPTTTRWAAPPPSDPSFPVPLFTGHSGPRSPLFARRRSSSAFESVFHAAPAGLLISLLRLPAHQWLLLLLLTPPLSPFVCCGNFASPARSYPHPRFFTHRSMKTRLKWR